MAEICAGCGIEIVDEQLSATITTTPPSSWCGECDEGRRMFYEAASDADLKQLLSDHQRDLSSISMAGLSATDETAYRQEYFHATRMAGIRSELDDRQSQRKLATRK